ncbi:MAG: isocitrate lyase/PEP mutase family protein [Desulfobacterales bacterium]|nr:isocitrate lyase/PEP mutase family protein [Desulfobacterales bacterium]
MREEKNLRKKIEEGRLVSAPGAYDALTAKIAASQGFESVYMTGFGTSVSHFGLPDMGFLTMTEMVENARRMSDAVEIPLIADADTGYGNAMNVVRTVREYENAGVSAIHLEDQTWPKRCGHMSGKQVVDAEEMLSKIRAAVDARRDPDFLIIARTDALAIEGFDAAIDRAHRFAEAGADILFVEAPQSHEQMAEIPKRLPERPLLINMAPLTPNLSMDELEGLGYSVAIFPGICLAAAIQGCMDEVRQLRENGRQKDFSQWGQSFADLNKWLEAPRYSEMEQRYRSDFDQKGNG